MIINDEWTQEYIKMFPDDNLSLECFGDDRSPEIIAMFERAFRENKPLTELYPEIKEFCKKIERGEILT